jgi:type I restriction enzyme S subunit
MATNQGFKSLIPGPELDSRFLYYAIKRLVPLIQERGNGATFKEVSKSIVSQIPISYPSSLQDQKRIAAILDIVDGIRRKQENALEMADTFLKSAFLDMFGDPVANPKMWPVRKLSQQASIKIGYPFQSKLYSDSGIRLCRGANVLPGELEWSDVRYWPKDDALKYEEFALKEGDVILALDRPWISSGLKVAQVRPGDLPALLVQRVARIRGKSRAHSDFIYQALTHPSFWQYCTPTETTVPHISPVELKDYPTIEPEVGTLDKFGLASAAVLSNRQKLEENFDESTRLFSSLSQRAFRGEL